MPSDPTPTPSSPAGPAPDAPRPDVYARIRHWAPVLVVLFCAGLLVVVALLRPFPSPPTDIELKDPLVGADFDPTGAYVVIHNTGGGDTLLGVTTPAATGVQLQEIQGKTDTDAGTLVDVQQLDVPGFEDLRLQPGDDQILLTGLTRPLLAGDTITLTLTFERAGTMTVEAEVASYDEIARRLLPSRLQIPSGTPAS